MFNYVIEALIGYFLASLSFSIILTKTRFKKDVREEGSGNAGATNVARVFGLKIGALTLLCDILKMVIPMYIGLYLDGRLGMAIAGIAGILGHCFPIYFGFKGGKGVSVAAAIAIFIDWRVTVIALSIFILMAIITKIVSISSVFAVTAIAVLSILFKLDTPSIVLGIATAVLVIFMHRENIVRLIRGEEKKFKAKK